MIINLVSCLLKLAYLSDYVRYLKKSERSIIQNSTLETVSTHAMVKKQNNTI